MAAGPIASQARPDVRPMNAAVRPYISELDGIIGARLDRYTQCLPYTLPVVTVDAVEEVFVGKRIVRNAAEKLLKGCRRSQRSLGRIQFPRAEMACEERGAQTLLALVEFLDEITRLELAPARFERRPRDADKCRGPEWPLQESDVASDLIERRCIGASF